MRRVTAPARSLLVALAVSGCSAQAAPTTGEATVRAVIDGDTIEVDYGPHRETVRLLGIDTPETKHPDKPVECFGPEAAALLGSLLPAGSVVQLARDVEARDRFGRLLAFVTRAHDGLDVQGALVDAGAADVLSIAPNRARHLELARRRDAARTAGAGQWGACKDEAPTP
jgi:micrococcal nuclease